MYTERERLLLCHPDSAVLVRRYRVRENGATEMDVRDSAVLPFLRVLCLDRVDTHTLAHRRICTLTLDAGNARCCCFSAPGDDVTGGIVVVYRPLLPLRLVTSCCCCYCSAQGVYVFRSGGGTAVPFRSAHRRVLRARLGNVALLVL